MILNSEEHRALLLEMLDKTQFVGAARKVIYELGQAIEKATIQEPSLGDKQPANPAK